MGESFYNSLTVMKQILRKELASVMGLVSAFSAL